MDARNGILSISVMNSRYGLFYNYPTPVDRIMLPLMFNQYRDDCGNKSSLNYDILFYLYIQCTIKQSVNFFLIYFFFGGGEGVGQV